MSYKEKLIRRLTQEIDSNLDQMFRRILPYVAPELSALVYQPIRQAKIGCRMDIDALIHSGLAPEEVEVTVGRAGSTAAEREKQHGFSLRPETQPPEEQEVDEALERIKERQRRQAATHDERVKEVADILRDHGWSDDEIEDLGMG